MNATQARNFPQMSAANAALVASHFACGCEPYDQVFTYKRWKAQGMQVQKGEKGLHLPTLIPIFDDAGEFVHCRKVTSIVFCKHQVAPLEANTQEVSKETPKPTQESELEIRTPKAKAKKQAAAPTLTSDGLRMSATFADGSTYNGDQAWDMLKAHKKPYSGAPQLKQMPHLKMGYQGTNSQGGRKCRFTQAKAYKF